MSLSSLIEKRKNYVRGDKVVINYLNVSEIGRNNKFQFIIQLYISHNKIRSLKGIEQFTQLELLAVNDNLIQNQDELNLIQNPIFMRKLSVHNNPFTKNTFYRTFVMKKFSKLQRLDLYELKPEIYYLYFNWLDVIEQQIQYVDFEQINQFDLSYIQDELNKYDPSLIVINQILTKIVSQTPKIDDQGLILFQRLLITLRNKYKTIDLQEFLVQQCLTNTNMYLFSQNSDIIQEQIYIKFKQYAQCDNAFPFSPFDKDYVLSIFQIIKSYSKQSNNQANIQEQTILKQPSQYICLQDYTQKNNIKVQEQINLQEIEFQKQIEQQNNLNMIKQKNQAIRYIFQFISKRIILNLSTSFYQIQDKGQKKFIAKQVRLKRGFYYLEQYFNKKITYHYEQATKFISQYSQARKFSSKIYEIINYTCIRNKKLTFNLLKDQLFQEDLQNQRSKRSVSCQRSRAQTQQSQKNISFQIKPSSNLIQRYLKALINILQKNIMTNQFYFISKLQTLSTSRLKEQNERETRLITQETHSTKFLSNRLKQPSRLEIQRENQNPQQNLELNSDGTKIFCEYVIMQNKKTKKKKKRKTQCSIDKLAKKLTKKTKCDICKQYMKIIG